MNFGVSFLHLKETENIENPIEDVIPKIKPIKEFCSVFPKAIIIIPIVAITMATYLTISLSISLFMNWYNKSIAIKEK